MWGLVPMAAYGTPATQDGDKIAIRKLLQACRPKGKLYLTVPAGRPCIERYMRIYDAEGIQDLVPNIRSMRFFSKANRYGHWQETTAEEISDLVYDIYYTTSPVQGIAFVVAEKR